jgi:predicted secreted hydrolase
MPELMKRAEWEKLEIGPKPVEVCGAPAFDDPERDLYLHEGVPGDSCWVVGHAKGEDGNIYDFLVHNGALVLRDDAGVVVAMVSLTDKTARRYYHEEISHPFAQCIFASDHFEIATPTSMLKGSSREFELYGQLPDRVGSIRVRLTNQGPAMQNCGAGLFPCVNGEVTFVHYGLPYLAAEGVIELEGRTVRITGDAWLDRQWVTEGNLVLAVAEHNVQTKWMNLNLSNGYKVSLWDIIADGGVENSWATVLSPDGATTIASMTPLLAYEDNYWLSPATGNYYATSYVVEIPSLDARVNVNVYDGIPNQEAVSAAGYNRYEAHSDCEGTFMGQPVTGFCCVELVGSFAKSPENELQAHAIDTTGTSLDPEISGSYKGTMHSPMGDQNIVFNYQVEGDVLTGTVNLMKRASPITDGHATAEGFTHKFKMEIHIGSIEATVEAKVEGDTLKGRLKTPMGELAFSAERQ